ncbi:MAG: hypothetical protein DSY36_01590, partial [Candidatus Neomarinimicrobiota bacterium]
MIRKILTLIILSSIVYPQDGIAIAKLVDERKVPQDIVSKTTMLLTNSKGKTILRIHDRRKNYQGKDFSYHFIVP